MVKFWNYYQTTLILSTEYMWEHGLQITTPCRKWFIANAKVQDTKAGRGKLLRHPRRKSDYQSGRRIA